MSTRVAMERFWEVGRKIVAIGRNYRDHAKELGNEVPTEPVIFLKPTTSYVREGGSIEVPPGRPYLHHEVELGVIIGKKGRDIKAENAMDYVAGYALALDMTDRIAQDALKSKGLPWTLAKGLDTFCPISDFIEKGRIDHTNCHLWLKIDGVTKQDGNTRDMLFPIPMLIQAVSRHMTLEPGDLLLTGTPAGVGPVKPGETITAGIGDIIKMSFPVRAAPS